MVDKLLSMRGVLLALLTGCLLLMIGVSRAAAVSCKSSPSQSCEPWWHVNITSAPAGEAGGDAEVVVQVSNLGDAATEAFGEPIKIVDALPAGLKIKQIYTGGGGSGGRLFELVQQFHLLTCASALQTITCEQQILPVLPYESVVVAIAVEVEPGAGSGENSVSVSGGGARPAQRQSALMLGSAPLQYGIQSYEMNAEESGGAIDTQAGSHPFQLTTTLGLNSQTLTVFDGYLNEGMGEFVSEVQPLAMTKDLRFTLPAGLVGNPTPLPKCSLYTFTQEVDGSATQRCPDDSIVGVASSVTTKVEKNTFVPLGFSYPIYNLEPSVGEPARFGFATAVHTPIILDASVRTGGDYNVAITVSNIDENIEVLGSQTTFWGVPADHRHDTARGVGCLNVYQSFSEWESACAGQKSEEPFLIMPASCAKALQTSTEGDSWEHPGEWTQPTTYTFANNRNEPVRPDGCNRLNFEPSIAVTPDDTQASTPTGLTVDTHIAQNASLNPKGLADSTVKKIVVTLPEGVSVNPAGADGLQACTDTAELGRPGGQIALQTGEPVECPDASKIGTLTAKTPLWPEAFYGSVYLGAQTANPFGSLLAIYIVAENKNAGVVAKLAGEVKLNEEGQLTTTIEVPQLPFEDAELHFFGGDRAPLATPAYCGSYTTSASVTPWSEPEYPVSTVSPPFEITNGPDGTTGTCHGPLPFAPKLTSGSLNIQAGAFTPFTMTMSREDGNQNLDAIQLKMPPGLLGTLSGVKLCGEPQAVEGTCGSESLIGHTVVSVGLGGNPYTVTGGRVYITGPYEGAPYGLSIVNPAKAGPFDLENTVKNHPGCDCLVVRARIEVDPVTAALTVTSDTAGPYRIPQMIEGIPLQIKHVNVTIDRPNFTFNPTNCKPLHITGRLTSTEGAISALAVPFQVTNCAVLKFKPVFRVLTSGKTSRAKGAGLDARLTYPKTPFGQGANIRYVKVELPKQLPSRLGTLQKACIDTVFARNPAACPAASRVGTATATTPILPVSLSGPAYFVSHGGAKFPELIIVLSGYGTTVYLHGETFINKKTGITSSIFKAIPDVPVGTFELKLPEGPYSALAAPGNRLCKTKLRMPTIFIAQNGRRLEQSTPITALGCARHKPKHQNKRRKQPHHRKQ